MAGGLVLLTRSLSQPPALRGYAAIAFTSIGAAVCGQALIGMMPEEKREFAYRWNTRKRMRPPRSAWRP